MKYSHGQLIIGLSNESSMKKNVLLKEMKCLQNHGNFEEIPTAKDRLCRYRGTSLRDFFVTLINAPLFFIKDGT